MNLDGFVKLEKVHRNKGDELSVTLIRNDKNGSLISLRRAAYAALGSPGRVVFLVDPDRRAIAIRPCSESVEHSYAVQRPERNACQICVQSVFSHYKISIKKMLIAQAIMLDGSLVLHWDGTEPGGQYGFIEFFDKGVDPSVNEMTVILYAAPPSYMMTMTRAVYRALGEPGEVDIYYNAITREVALVRAEGPRGYEVRQCSKNVWGVGIRRLVTTSGIMLEHSEKFRVKAEDGGIRFDLDRGTPLGKDGVKTGRPSDTGKFNKKDFLRRAVKEYQALASTGGKSPSSAAVAEVLGMGRTTFYENLERCGMKDFRAFKQHALQSGRR